jgi:hypothetical protein
MIEFNEKKHEYKVDGVICPGVTTVLKDVGIIDFSGIPKKILDRAAHIGTCVHKACELEDNRCLDYATVSPVILPYLEAWKKFETEYCVEIIENEKQIFCKRFFYAGTLDRVCKIKGELFLIDIKTGIEQYWHGIQLAAYKRALQEMNKEYGKIKMACIYLSKDGKAKPPKIYKDRLDFDSFMHALSIYNLKRR